MLGFEVKYMPAIAGRRANMEYIDALEELEYPPHRGVDTGLPYLVRDALPTLGQALPQTLLGQPIHQKAHHHHTAQCHDALGLLYEHRGGQRERVLEEAESSFDATLPFVGRYGLLLG